MYPKVRSSFFNYTAPVTFSLSLNSDPVRPFFSVLLLSQIFIILNNGFIVPYIMQHFMLVPALFGLFLKFVNIILNPFLSMEYLQLFQTDVITHDIYFII